MNSLGGRNATSTSGHNPLSQMKPRGSTDEGLVDLKRGGGEGGGGREGVAIVTEGAVGRFAGTDSSTDTRTYFPFEDGGTVTWDGSKGTDGAYPWSPEGLVFFVTEEVTAASGAEVSTGGT